MKNTKPASLLGTFIAATAAMATLVGCDQTSDVQSLRSESRGEMIWLSATRPVIDQGEAVVSFGLATDPKAQTPKAPIMALPANQVCLGVAYRDASGDDKTGTKSCGLTSCTADGTIGCLTTNAYQAIEIATVDFAKIVKGTTIGGQMGTYDASDPKYALCGKTGQKSCTANSTYFAVSGDIVKNENIKLGIGRDLLSGSYPSAASPLAAALPQGTKALTASNMDAALGKPEETYVFWNAKGEKQELKADANMVALNIIKDNTIFGIGGLADKTTAKTCGGIGKTDCSTKNTNFVAVNTKDISPAKVRNGVTIAGIEGKYGSADAPLDLGTSGNKPFAINDLGTAGTYVLFNSKGKRIELTGSTDLTAANLRKNVSFFGKTGTLEGFDFSSVRPIDVRYGVDIGSGGKKGAAKLQVSCASAAECIGADKAWQDVTQATMGGNSSCGTGQSYCVYRNQLQQLDWAFYLENSTKNWEDSVSHCRSLDQQTVNKKKWRLATQKELQIAAAQSLHKLGHYGFYQGGNQTERGFWSSTINFPKTASVTSPQKDRKIAYKVYNNLVWSEQKDKTHEIACVREVSP